MATWGNGRPAIEQAPAAGPGEGRFFATVFLGSGLLFVGMLLAADLEDTDLSSQHLH